MPYSTRQTKQVNEKKRSRPTSAGPPSGPRAKKVKRLNANALEINSNETIEATSDITHNVNMNEDRTLEHSSALSLPASIPDKLLSIEQEMCTKLRDITFPVIAQYIYNPLEYASKVHAMYVQKYCNGTKKILFLGMNPGPWGMSQTGVPFGEIDMVSNWLKISGSVDKPPKEHPDRKVTGFQCTRSEVSGKRFWGLLQNICVIPENFFQDAYVHNYCPLALMDTKARNITPAELTKAILISFYAFPILNCLIFCRVRHTDFCTKYVIRH